MSRRVFITGVGVVAPGGASRDDFWKLLMDGRTATRTLSLCDPTPFRSQVAAEVDLDPEVAGLSERQVEVLDRAAQFALVAAREAVTDAGWRESCPPERAGVVIGSAVGATTRLEQVYRELSLEGRLWDVMADGPQALYSYFVPSSFAAEVAAEVGARGQSAVISTGCTSGIDAVGHAWELIQDGVLDCVVAGATEAPISPITVACFDAIKATSTYNDTPASASRPFDVSRGGFVLGEGSAMFVLESEESAVARGARVYGEIRGYASRGNAFHMTGLTADGLELAAAVTSALGQARLRPDQVDYVNAHGSGTKLNDKHETAALKASLGEAAHHVPISSIKSMVGHSLGAIGAIEIAACAMALRYDCIPPTANLHTPDPALDLDYVPLHSRSQRTDAVLTTGSGFGGFQSAMVLTAPGMFS
ncbi:beta-ACP synthase [Kineosporia sp. NBRC 101677]|uniref:beta-ketoacyl-[acyl-carrier-protein] synthase family protein n=1 Tax=Kineosporia TaxID=49184 RepID=UPI0024A33645|nr:beta-ketoacyl-[acyl-carrier-protein] synthase family protein [Kineosporia sp. NBRC 101677]GLY18855.1 beta-ACP synthase [Kineosporia sp. NBRC 101677]